jgi:hypothetical protein
MLVFYYSELDRGSCTRHSNKLLKHASVHELGSYDTKRYVLLIMIFSWFNGIIGCFAKERNEEERNWACRLQIPYAQCDVKLTLIWYRALKLVTKALDPNDQFFWSTWGENTLNLYLITSTIQWNTASSEIFMISKFNVSMYSVQTEVSFG